MSNKEIVVNLWFIGDEAGLIYSLRAMAYVAEGTDEEKLRFLQQRAVLDYLVAAPFEVPARFHVQISDGSNAHRMPVGHTEMLRTLDSPIALFEDALKLLESRMPAQTEMEIGSAPLTCTTPLMQNEDGAIEPRIVQSRRY